MYEGFLEVVHNAIDRFVPLSNPNKPKRLLPAYIQKTIDFRSKLLPFAHFPNVSEKISRISSQLEKLLNKYFGNVEKRILSSSKTGIYSYIRSKTKSVIHYPALSHNTSTAYTTSQKATIFLNHFISIYQPNVIQPDKVASVAEKDGLFDYSLFLIQDHQIYELLRKLPAKPNTTPDSIPSIVLKKCAATLAQPLANLLRRSFLAGTVPSAWKKSIIIPLYKTGEASSPNNYRPICLTSNIAKLAEKLIHEDISGFVKALGIIPTSQHGFQDNKSVTTLLLETTDQWTHAIDNKKMIDVIYFDLRKAFDKINLHLLIKKLKDIGLTGLCLSWISNFLLDRSVSVKVGSHVSSSQTVKAGVPQGCILSPLLFNIFVADLTTSFADPNVVLKSFADDCKAYIIYDKSDKVAKKNSLRSFITHFENWCVENGQELSEKCFALYMGSGNQQEHYYLGKSPINPIQDSIRDLGLIVTPNLKWKKHVQTKISATLRKWYNFMRIVKSTNLNTLCLIYKSYIRPTIEFPSIIFNAYSPSFSLPLEKVQKRITRHICSKSGKFINQSLPNYQDRLKILKLEPLEIRRFKHDLVMMHKINNGIITQNPIQDNPDFPIHSHNTRFQRRGTVIKRARLLARYNSFFVRVPKKFCKLPLDIQHITDPILFRKKLDNIDLSNLLA
jgi:hypothetical protein